MNRFPPPAPAAATFALVGLTWLLLLTGTARCQPVIDSNLAVNTLDGSTIGLYFDQPVSSAQAAKASNYQVYGKSTTGGLATVTNAVLQSDGQSVALYLSAPVGQYFAVTVSNVNAVGSSTVFATTQTGYTSDYSSVSIGTNSNPNPAGQVFTALRDTFTIAASGSGIGGLADHCQFVYEKVIGDFDVSVLVTNLTEINAGAMAGLMARNTLDAGSPMALINFTPALGLNQIQTSGRTSLNAPATPFVYKSGASGFSWLRLQRTGGTLYAYFGTDGVNWNLLGTSLPVALGSSVYVGMAATSNTNGLVNSATFTDFGITAARPGDGVVPTISAALYQGNSVVLRWPITPRDFAVEVATNLVYATNTTSGGTNHLDVTQWNLFNLPILDSTLTGTNTAMPVLGRYMIIPLNLFTNGQMFFRMMQVARVIPDPPIALSAGIVLSVGTGGLVHNASAANQLCNLQVNTASAVSQAGTYIVCPTGHTYQFTTAPSGASLNTAIQVTSWFNLAVKCDSTFSAGNNKSQVTVTNKVGSGIYGYSFVAAATTATSANCQVQVEIWQN